jgi:hypothetical protein
MKEQQSSRAAKQQMPGSVGRWRFGWSSADVMPVLQGAPRRGVLTCCSAALLICCSVPPPAALAQDDGRPAPPDRRPTAENIALEDEITPELEVAVNRGLSALAQMQNEDGSYGAGRFGRNVAVTSLACLAFMADGNLPGRGPYGEHVERGLDYVLRNSTESGLIADEASHGPMYGHGFATLFLGEIYGQTAGGPETPQSARLHEALVKAVRLIEGSQNAEGGWRYNPLPYDADVSVTICQVMALRSARNAGIEVNAEVIDKAVEYVLACQNPDGGFRYQMQLGESLWPRSAAGVATLFYAGIYEGDEIDRGLQYIRRTAMPGRALTSRSHYHYGHYYAVQAMYLAGGEQWAAWWPAIRRELLNQQTGQGVWEDRSIGDAYATSMNLIILQMPKRYLPIFQK